ncbi:MAG: C40 family peptidase [Mycobacteriaceae bacterium]
MAWSSEQRRNAAIIYKVGLSVGASLRDIQTAIMAAIVESGLRNLDYGDRDSIGMFQQRDAWGSREARLDPYQSAKMFFLGGHAGQRGLLDITNRNSMSLGEAAQTVQVSAFPDRYAEHQSEAAALLSGIGNIKVPDANPSGVGNSSTTTTTLGQVPGLQELLTNGEMSKIPDPPSVAEVNGVGQITADAAGIGEMKFDTTGATATDGSSSGGPLDALTFGMSPKMPDPATDPMAKLHMPSLSDLGVQTPSNADQAVGDGWRSAVVAAAHKMLGTPYVWGGTSYSGVDCSGLVALIYNKMGFNLPRLSADQARSGVRVALDKLQPGDLVGWDNSSRNNGADHIAIYIGNGMIIEAPRPGGVVQISHLYDTGEAWGVHIVRH